MVSFLLINLVMITANYFVYGRSWTKDENNVTLEDWEGFLAIWNSGEERWQLFFDKNDNGCGLPKGTRGVEISLR